MTWYKKAIRKYIIEDTWKMLSVVIIWIITSLWLFFTSDQYTWTNVEPIQIVSASRLIVWALTFITLGAFLYAIRFYQFLHLILVQTLWIRKFYNTIKTIIWLLLLFIMFFWVLPFVVFILNQIYSFFHNTVFFILYMYPVIFSSIIIFTVIHFWIKRYDVKRYWIKN